MTTALQIEINPIAIRHNIHYLTERLQSARIIAVLKENAYGHGMLPMAQLCQEEGIPAIAVISVDEGCRLRAEGITIPIFLLARPLAEEISVAIYNRLTLPLSTVDDIEFIQSYLMDHPGVIASTSLAVNTGMNRYGFKPEEVPSVYALLQAEPRMQVVQVYTHLTNADEVEDLYSPGQYEAFQTVLEKLPLTNYSPSIANSAAIMRYPYMISGDVRIGCLLLGLSPIDGEPMSWPLQPAYTCHSTVTHVHKVGNHEPIGYGRTYTTTAPTYIATIAGGYGCGLPKTLSNKGHVLIYGNAYPIVGSLCMSQFMVDLGPETNIVPGDIVTILGKDGDKEITIYEIAEQTDRNYLEILMNMSAHSDIIYKED